MARVLVACCLSVAALGATAAAAEASTVLVLDSHGKVRKHKAVSSATEPSPRAHAARKKRRHKGPTVAAELKRMLGEGALTPEDYAAKRAAYKAAKAKAKRLHGARRVEMRGVIADLDSMAARHQLTPPRLGPLWLTLERNLEWWTTGPLLGSGQRVGFSGSELIWQHYPRHGIQIQWLGTFGKLNGLWKSRSKTRMGRLLDEALSLATPRAGGIAWEYLFPFDGQRPPWVSSLAQGTALQSLARAAVRAGRAGELLPLLHQGLGIFLTPPPEGVRLDVDGGAHYLQYSGLPRLQILNGFIQSLVGLYDYAAITADPTAQALFASGDAAAQVEVPRFDTGAWSLYSRGSSKHESSLSYHDLLRDFLDTLCERTGEEVYCGAAAHFDSYLGVPPVLQLAPATARAGKAAKLRFKLSKISRISVRVERAGKLVAVRSPGVLSYGTKVVRWTAPRKPGAYDVEISATDLAGNSSDATGTVLVARPKHKKGS